MESPKDRHEPQAEPGAPHDRARAKQLTEEVARENAVTTSSGNREFAPDTKGTDAQHGGPDLAKADRRQPPDATRRPLSTTK
jgi:hypothetical protein